MTNTPQMDMQQFWVILWLKIIFVKAKTVDKWLNIIHFKYINQTLKQNPQQNPQQKNRQVKLVCFKVSKKSKNAMPNLRHRQIKQQKFCKFITLGDGLVFINHRHRIACLIPLAIYRDRPFGDL